MLAVPVWSLETGTQEQVGGQAGKRAERWRILVPGSVLGSEESACRRLGINRCFQVLSAVPLAPNDAFVLAVIR